MQRRALAFVILALVLGSIGFGLNAPHAPNEDRTAVARIATSASSSSTASVQRSKVIHVVDGDTVDVLFHGERTRLRLIGLDTPETVDPYKPVQCFGIEASNEAKQLLDGQSVRVELDPSQGTLDKYGRTLAYIYLPDGTLFNELMIAEGYGREYTYRTPYKYQAAFRAAQAEARSTQRGLWAPDACAKSN